MGTTPHKQQHRDTRPLHDFIDMVVDIWTNIPITAFLVVTGPDSQFNRHIYLAWPIVFRVQHERLTKLTVCSTAKSIAAASTIGTLSAG